LFYFFQSSFGTNSIITESPPSVLETIDSKSAVPSPVQSPAVLRTESVHVNIDNNRSVSSPKIHAVNNVNKTMQPAVIEIPKTKAASSVLTEPTPPGDSRLRTIELSTGRVREGFGEFVVSWGFLILSLTF
jgi:hypothetical protein